MPVAKKKTPAIKPTARRGRPPKSIPVPLEASAQNGCAKAPQNDTESLEQKIQKLDILEMTHLSKIQRVLVIHELQALGYLMYDTSDPLVDLERAASISKICFNHTNKLITPIVSGDDLFNGTKSTINVYCQPVFELNEPTTIYPDTVVVGGATYIRLG